MKVFGVTLLIAGLLFVLYTIPPILESDSHTVSWAPWVGILVIITGGITYFIARKEE